MADLRIFNLLKMRAFWNPDGGRLGDLAEFLEKSRYSRDRGGIIGFVCRIRLRVPE